MCGCFQAYMTTTSRQAVVSHAAKKKQHAHTSSGLCDHYSELFTWMAALYKML